VARVAATGQGLCAVVVAGQSTRSPSGEGQERNLAKNLAKDVAKSLNLSLNRFAKWRWSTLAKVVRDLLRVREAVKLALGSMSSSNEFATRDEDLAREFWSIANSDLLWVRAEGLSSVVKPMRSMQGWLRGCSCHESECLANDNVKCPWKGC